MASLSYLYGESAYTWKDGLHIETGLFPFPGSGEEIGPYQWSPSPQQPHVELISLGLTVV